MKTYEEFLAEKEKIGYVRPGEPGSELGDFYVAFTCESGKYSFIEGPETIVKETDFAGISNAFLDLVERCPFRYDLNFSEGFSQNEKDLLARLNKVVKEMQHFKGLSADYSAEAASYRPAAIRAASRGLVDKFR